MGDIISGERRLSAPDLRDRAARAAAGLASLGVGRGDVIALYLRNDFAFFEASYAAGLIGAYPTPVNWHYAPEEARYLFMDSGARAIIIHADLIASVRSALPNDVPIFVVPTPPEIAEAYGITQEMRVAPTGMRHWNDWLEGFEPFDGLAADPPGTIIYDPPSVWWTPMLAFRSWRGVSNECGEAPGISGVVQA
jgi:long-chain acyl-CoA synthetase